VPKESEVKGGMKTNIQSPEVFVTDEAIVQVSRRDIASLCEKGVQNVRGRCRLCTHRDVDDSLHEMFIVHTKDAYVRPHKHLSKTESVHIIEGLADVVVFDDDGSITKVIRMGDYASGFRFYYRMSEPYYHMLLIRSDVVVFHETTNGPFKRTDTCFAVWSPDETDRTGQETFMRKVDRAVEEFVSNK
jgi:cupin fold WbuC family metalloprotein